MRASCLLLTLLVACRPADPGDADKSGTDSAAATDRDGDGFFYEEGDCDDTDGNVFPGAQELCNGRDDDCDDAVDEGVTSTYYQDADADGFGNPEASVTACAPGDAEVDNGLDCDDADAGAYPGGSEACDGVDNDCDGIVDNGVSDTWYADADRDGHGDPLVPKEACEVPEGYVPSSDDCDDTDPESYAGAEEVCDLADNDCDGSVDEDAVDALTWYLDYDSDGVGGAKYTSVGCEAPPGYVASDDDCDDSEAGIYPGATEACNELDDDCDGSADEGLTRSTWYEDSDGDGYGDAGSTLDDCSTPSGYVGNSGDCDDGDGAINPAATEACNGADDDCDGSVDEGVLGTSSSCPAEDCTEVLDSDPSATDGNYHLDAGSYHCDMTTDGGGWTRVADNLGVYGTGYDSSYYNSEGFTWTETLFQYDSGSVHAHCTYPDDLTGCNNLGFQFDSENWGTPLNWGSSICGMSTTDYSSYTDYIGGYDFVVARSSSTDTVRLGTLEGISSCTTSDNPGTAYVDVYVRR